jgi:hypothetical protein
VQEPAVTNVNAPPEVIVQTPVVVDVNVGVKPEEAVAVKVGVVPKVCAPGGLKVMVCGLRRDAAVQSIGISCRTVYKPPLVRP